MSAWIWICTAAYFIAVAVFVYATYRRSPKTRVLTKAGASALFVLVGALCALSPTGGPGAPAYAPLMLAGLCLGMAGDVLLECQHLYPEKQGKLFIYGLASFLLGHLFYMVLFFRLAPVGWPQPLAALAVFGLLLLLKRRFAVQPGKMAVPVYLYAAIVSVMLGAALGATLWHPGPGRAIYLAGALLFCVSDALLAYLYFGPKKVPLLRGLNVSFYYAAQILFALSIWVR